VLDVAAVLRDLRHTSPQQVVEVLDRVASPVASDLTLYLVDFQQAILQPLQARSDQRVITEENVSASLAGRAFTTDEAVTAERTDGTRVWVPVHEHSVRTGVLAMTVSSADGETLEHCTGLGVLAGLLVASGARYTDVIHARRRGRSMSLPASMQWDLLPPLTLECDGAVVSGLLEPAYEVAGDGFDHAINGDRLDFAMFDGMGHGIGSSLLTGLAMGAYRHARRNGEGVETMHLAVDGAVEQQFAGDAFVTGVLARLDLTNGRLSWTNAGHPPPMLLRDRKVVGELNGNPSLPFGLGESGTHVRSETLQPGDSVLLYTDGVVEARTDDGEEFGSERLADLLEREAAAESSPEETLRRLVRSVLEHQSGELRDDATLLLLRWAGPAAVADEPSVTEESLHLPEQDHTI
jgi:hypothetical protein